MTSVVNSSSSRLASRRIDTRNKRQGRWRSWYLGPSCKFSDHHDTRYINLYNEAHVQLQTFRRWNNGTSKPGAVSTNFVQCQGNKPMDKTKIRTRMKGTTQTVNVCPPNVQDASWVGGVPLSTSYERLRAAEPTHQDASPDHYSW